LRIQKVCAARSMEKIIVEKNQGQTLILDYKEGNTKKLFIESYGCAMNLAF
jgi:tRNA-2-methylthio-N6-dimethylallyladenosine synthase